MSVEEAYRTIPHAQTTFDMTQSRMAPDEGEFLSKLFFLVDEAVRNRVEAMQGIQAKSAVRVGITISEYNERHDVLIASLDSLPVPYKLKNVKNLITGAINEQKGFLNHAALATPEDKIIILGAMRQHPMVLGSHQRLVTAYMHLMKIYPGEGEHNKRAFYDHLCALDFI